MVHAAPQGPRLPPKSWGGWRGKGRPVGLAPDPDLSPRARVAGLHRHTWPGSPRASADLVLRKVCNRQDSTQLPGAGGREGDRAQGWAKACLQGRAGGRPTFAGDAVGGAPVENHPLEERVVVDVLLGPRGAEAAGAAALLLAQLRLVQHLAAAVPGLAQPAVPGCGDTDPEVVGAARRARGGGARSRGRGKHLEGGGGRGSRGETRTGGVGGGRGEGASQKPGPQRPGPPSRPGQLPGTQTRHVQPGCLSPGRLGRSAFARPGSEPAATRRADSGTWQKQDGRLAGERGGVTVKWGDWGRRRGEGAGASAATGAGK